MNLTFFNPDTKELVTGQFLKFQGMDIDNPEILECANYWPVTYNYPDVDLNAEAIEPKGLPKNVDGVYIQEFVVKPIADEILEKTLERIKGEKLEQVRKEADKAAEPFLAEFSTPEKMTFDMQMQEVLNYQANAKAATPILDALAAGRGIPREELIQKALAKVTQLQMLSGAIVGKQQGYEDAINGIVASNKSLKDKIIELDNLEFDFSLPTA